MARNQVTIYCVSTAVEGGRGGISSVLSNLRATDTFSHYGVVFIHSHCAGGSRFRTFATSLCRVFTAANRDAVFWFHCGPWLSTLRKLVLATVARMRGATIVFHMHSVTFERALHNPLGRLAYFVMFRMVAHGIVVLTPWWEALFGRFFPSMRTKLTVSLNPVAAEWAQLAARPARKSGTKRVLAVSRLLPGKGVECVVDALRCLPAEFTLVIAGEGPTRAVVERRIQEHSLSDRVELRGWVDGKEKLDLFLDCDVYCLPSSYDSFGMTYIEAMAAGLPVVALATGPVEAVVRHGVTGWLVDAPIPERLADAIMLCWERRAEYGAAGKAEVLQHYQPEAIARALMTRLLNCRISRFNGCPTVGTQ